MWQLGDFCTLKHLNSPFEPHEKIFSFEDLLLLFHKLKFILLRVAIVSALLFLTLFLWKSPLYKIEASFKEGIEKGDAQSPLKEIFIGMGGAQPQVITLMKSNRVLRPLVEKFGLQGSISNQQSLLRKTLHHLLSHWRAERGMPLPESDRFEFANIRYENTETAATYYFLFLDRDRFEILDSAKRKQGLGTIHEPVKLGQVEFTCTRVPSTLLLRKEYLFQIVPWPSAVSRLKQQLKIIPQKASKSVYDLTLDFEERHLGAHLLNALMEEYRHYLKQDHDQVAAEQMAYLEQKQAQVYNSMGQMFDEHAAYLKQVMKEDGFVDLKEESLFYAKTHQELYNEKTKTELELERLAKGGSLLRPPVDSPFAPSFAHSRDSLQKLEQERDLLEVALETTPYEEASLVERLEQIASLRVQKGGIASLLASLSSSGGEAPQSLPSPFTWASDAKRSDLAQYLEHHLHLLSVREKTLQERLGLANGSSKEFEGLPLDATRNLHIEYAHQLDTAEASLRHYKHLREKIQEPTFELPSLAGVLKDPFSLKVLESAGTVALQVKDEKNRSPKEGDRWKGELGLQKKILTEHLSQLIQVEELNIGLFREKIRALQQLTLGCIHQQISILRQKMDEVEAERIATLKEEHAFQDKRLASLKQNTSHFPDKWKRESWLQLKQKMGTKVMGVMTDLVESKTISNHLHHVESKPLDNAITPLFAKKNFLLQMSLAGGFGSAFFVFFLALLQNLWIGFPMTARKLRDLYYPFSGKISSFCSGLQVELPSSSDLETLRRIALFIDHAPTKKKIALLGNQGPDYAFALAENLARADKKILLLRCDFPSHFREEERPGLLQYLQGELSAIPVRQGPGYDWVSAGGFSTFSVECLQSKKFADFLHSIETSYDLILFWLQTPLENTENSALLHLSDLAVVTILEERIEELTPFLKWGYDEKTCRLTFITGSP